MLEVQASLAPQPEAERKAVPASMHWHQGLSTGKMLLASAGQTRDRFPKCGTNFLIKMNHDDR